MTKTTIELDRMKRHWAGWGLVLDKWGGQDNSLVLDALIKWSGDNPGRKVYRHVYWQTEENKSIEPTLVDTSCIKQHPVYHCDLVRYLDIYWQ